MVREELNLDTPRHCFFGSIEEILARWQEGAAQCARKGRLQDPLGLSSFAFVS